MEVSGVNNLLVCKWLKIVHKVWALSLMYKVTVADFAFYKKKKVGRAFEDNFFRGGVGGWEFSKV